MQNNLNQFSTPELIQRLANAMHTGACCGGHTKSDLNRRISEEYRDELAARGATIPSDKELYAQGTFNGGGSF